MNPIYVPGIDGLRAVAVLSVVAYHLVPSALPGGFTGVDVFFVISGFVVTKSLAGSFSPRWCEFLARASTPVVSRESIRPCWRAL